LFHADGRTYTQIDRQTDRQTDKTDRQTRQTDRQTERRTDVTKLIAAFHNCANEPKNEKSFITNP